MNKCLLLSATLGLITFAGCITSPLDDGEVLSDSNTPFLVEGYFNTAYTPVSLKVRQATVANPNPNTSSHWTYSVDGLWGSGTVSFVGETWRAWSKWIDIREANWFPHSGPEGAYKAHIMGRWQYGTGFYNMTTYDSHPINCPGTELNDLDPCQSSTAVITIYTDTLVGTDCGDDGEVPCPGTSVNQRCPFAGLIAGGLCDSVQ